MKTEKGMTKKIKGALSKHEVKEQFKVLSQIILDAEKANENPVAKTVDWAKQNTTAFYLALGVLIKKSNLPF